jgi:predicted RNA-binding Zn-ribbon protein involved in translation (DUF1610 family)
MQTLQVELIRARYNIPTSFWRCPHCGLENGADDLVRIDGDNFRCNECGMALPASKGEERAR